jgi:hypothetical protein
MGTVFLHRRDITSADRTVYLRNAQRLDVSSCALSLSEGSVLEPGVAWYFSIFGNHCVIAVDTFDQRRANFMSLASMIQSLAALRTRDHEQLRRQILLLRVDAHVPSWAKFFGFSTIPTRTELDKAYKTAVLKAHPDRGGTTEAMRQVNEAMAAARDHYRDA